MLVRERLCPCSMNLTHFNELVRISTNLCAFHWTWRISGAIHIMTQQTQSISCVSTLKHLRKNFHFKLNFWQSRYFTFAWDFRFLFCLIKAYTSQLSNVCGVVSLSLTLSSDLSYPYPSQLSNVCGVVKAVCDLHLLVVLSLLSFFCGWPSFGFKQFRIVNSCHTPDISTVFLIHRILNFFKRLRRKLGWIEEEKNIRNALKGDLPTRSSYAF